ncbi:MAG: hypothetical protein A3F72_21535 [Bacteroidetes bacterium RIFCSPLOWO2_12_FULL_35_15]|nr:MAG: hypothetical protein A3F72_21535 [Bacteroidetes bacterium RIFCSPLOWO2_12_FULL_35_15]
MKTSLRIVICFLLLTTNSFAQNRTAKSVIDSLRTLLQNAKEDTVKVNCLNNLSSEYEDIGSYDIALNCGYQALRLAQQLKLKKGISLAYTALGNAYLSKGNHDKALENHLAAWKINEKMGDKIGISSSYKSIGNVYYRQRNFDRALENYLASLKIAVEINNKEKITDLYINIGNIYLWQSNYGKALENYFRALKTGKETGNKRLLAISQINIGNVYEAQGKYDKALENYLAAQKITEAGGNKLYIAAISNNIGIIYKKKKNYKEAIFYLKKGVNLSTAIGVKDLTMEGYQELAGVYEKMKDFENAYQYQQFYSQIKDSIFNNESNKKMIEMQNKYESEKKEKTILLLNKDNALQDAEVNKQKLIRNGFIGGLILALLLAFTLFNRFKVTSKQKKIIESQNFQIVESINYSKKIQNSLLPDISDMQKSLSNLFVFYEPKDIVSGDFYYFSEFEKYSLLACVDCTGHGVPGGFMSTLGSLLLDKIVNSDLLSPSEILTKLSDEIIRVLHQQDGGEIQDGMDLSICLIDRNNKKIEFSGARNGIVVITDGQAKRYKAELFPVGGNYMKKDAPFERNFKTQTISINQNDWIYMYTDGFMEQVGGEEGVPMNYTQFENRLIAATKHQNPKEKNMQLQTEIDKWRGKHERDDDVLIMGFQII